MKRIILLIPLLILPACASKKPVVARMPHSIPGTTLPSDDIESVRYGENLKAYPVGRYVDPNNGLVMHEAHTVYRVETTAKWNLHPNAAANLPAGPVVGVVDPARKESPVTAEVVAEVNRQKAATQSLIEQGARMNRALNQDRREHDRAAFGSVGGSISASADRSHVHHAIRPAEAGHE
jgi:hypothetical protein